MDMLAVRKRLEGEKSRLEGVLDAAGRGLGGGELDTSVEVRVRSELAAVEAALGRLDAGRYGLCEVCGGEIAEARLEAMPAARYCVADQARAEKDARLRGAH